MLVLGLQTIKNRCRVAHFSFGYPRRLRSHLSLPFHTIHYCCSIHKPFAGAVSRGTALVAPDAWFPRLLRLLFVAMRPLASPSFSPSQLRNMSKLPAAIRPRSSLPPQTRYTWSFNPISGKFTHFLSSHAKGGRMVRVQVSQRSIRSKEACVPTHRSKATRTPHQEISRPANWMQILPKCWGSFCL